MDGFGFATIVGGSSGRDAERHAAQVRTGLIGAGAVGARHAVRLSSHPLCAFMGVADVAQSRADAAARHAGVRAFPSVADLIAACDAVVVAAPASAHADIAAQALAAGRHVLVEKPLAATPAEAERLVGLAHRHGVVLQAGHQERFLIDALGLRRLPEAPLRIETVRAAPATGRGLDVSVTLDLMIHDLDVLASLFGASPLETKASGDRDRIVAELGFAAGDAVLTADRTAAAPVHTLRAVFESGIVDVDFLAGRVANSTPYALNASFAADMPDPMSAGVAAFLAAAAGIAPCVAPGEAGAAAVRLAAAIDNVAARRR